MIIQQLHRTSDRLDSFIDCGFDLYRDDPNWVPPLREELRHQLAPDTGLAQGPGADMAHFVAESGPEVVGRVSAMVNPALCPNGRPVGTIGFFECIEDVQVASALFAAARQWLREVHGIDRVWGPMNFDIWHDYRLMTKGHSRTPFSGEPWNKDYYPTLFERCGWTAIRKWESVDLGRDGIAQTVEWGRARHARALEDGYRFRDFDPRRFEEEIARLYGLLSDSFSGFLGYTPISREDFVRHFAKMRHALVPGWFTFVENPDGELAGFSGAFLDLSDALRSMRGQAGLSARIRFAWHRKMARRAVFYVVGLTPAEARSERGLGGAAVCQVARRLQADGVNSAVAALMPADGRSRSLVAGRGTMPAQREYTLYGIEP